ncbi:hypothetical protein [Saccharopolyspora sp. 5N708]|uniref:hypothetical protein n=1 Tax=Saccharopolyspora sp. 5N708 TaxID=3457424 RepID=UPI003FD11492
MIYSTEPKITARDYFHAPGGQATHDAAELAEFEEAALHPEASEHGQAPPGKQARLRVVDRS